MKYYIPGLYYSNYESKLLAEWRKGKIPNSSFKQWIYEQAGPHELSGNWEDGWTIHFNDPVRYTWFILRWSA